ncbi:Exopolysaccharide biosynthesis protein EpsI, predicted pyruvyl transferase [Halobiforma haloterrestris]|uniref:Exopolysaccharide biosynthesis protein EpsI, predicted pyruvyl transferase n=1 Tax=Natronobacterium haloterrestre TaxID=148448 RepID=A0A1I1KMY5_NATHA|nr:polysaccharide pyruvyl transferase family protein [Halobiforma haloterrestris]SFC60018.1 Exopolysaccharide biosynthesis protein EpsI, predicted pyruvyl transferase [Halobiforma haloterrestris]
MKVASRVDEVSDGGPILTLQPGGNHGDSLIYLGARKLFNETNIPILSFGSGPVRHDAPKSLDWANPRSIYWLRSYFPFLKHRYLSDFSAVYIHGGGNFSEINARSRKNSESGSFEDWGGGVKCYKTAGQFFDCPIIIGPQSCAFSHHNPREVFEDVTNETVFFCREKYSYDLISDATASCDHVEVDLADDTAFHLSQSDLPVDNSTAEYTLLAFRNDAESVTPQIDETIEPPIVSRDISRGEPEFADFVNRAAAASTIHTDRLHVAVLGHILDKDVVFYDNGYHKNRGVYEFSLSDASNVQFKYIR